MNLIRKVKRAIHILTRLEPNDERIQIVKKMLISELAHIPAHSKSTSNLIAIQGVRDPIFYSLFSGVITDIRKKIPVNARLLLVASINGAVGVGWRQFVLRSFPISWLLSSQWARANRRLVGPIAYRSQSFSHILGDTLDWFRAGKIWKTSQSEFDFAKLIVDRVLIGDLVIDTYLRFRPSPKFRAADPFVRSIIWQALRDLRRARRFFMRSKPKLYLSSYSTYIEHGIAVRVAIECGVTVRIYGNPAAFGKRLSKNDFYHTPDTSHYAKDFSSLANQAQCLVSAEQALKYRMSGGIDLATSYMRVSAYQLSDEPIPNVSGEFVIFLHDFYDSPHVYPDLVFPDFWSWITFTIEVLEREKIGFFVKPHPNQISMSDAAFDGLLKRYPEIRVISPKITNLQLAQSGMRCGVTVYGTVAHELAYLGIPTVGCARHPHHAFDFCLTASTREQYTMYLQAPETYSLPKVDMRDQALRFYYMHNMNSGDDTMTLRNYYTRFFKVADSQVTDAEVMSECLSTMRSLPAWKKHIDQLVEEVMVST